MIRTLSLIDIYIRGNKLDLWKWNSLNVVRCAAHRARVKGLNKFALKRYQQIID